jgi:hypothetical protein
MAGPTEAIIELMRIRVIIIMGLTGNSREPAKLIQPSAAYMVLREPATVQQKEEVLIGGYGWSHFKISGHAGPAASTAPPWRT